jgi:two-component system, cell cycle sensor histidine kinase and response regulator CckA
MPVKRILQEKDAKFKILFAQHPQPMWVVDTGRDCILEANDAAVDLYRYSHDEFINRPLSDIEGDADAGRTIDSGGGRPFAGSFRHRTKDGRLIDVEIATHPIRYGGHEAALAVIMDSTGRRHLEEQLRQAQKMEAVGMLAGGVAHDFNNLLTIINGYSQVILNNLRPEDPNRHAAEQIMKAGDRAAGLTRQLLAFSRRQVLQPRVLDLNTLVTSLGNMLQRLIGEDIDLRLVLRSDLGRINADPGKLEQVLMNLAVNSRDAMPKGGILTIETANVLLDEQYAASHMAVKSGPYILVAVSDTGCGMDEATRSHLFEPFFTTKAAGKGTGLGLSTVFGIVKQSGGSLEVYSEPDRGTSVKVYLPRIDQPVALEAEKRGRAGKRATETVLLVEDDEMVRNLVRETLAREGYKVMDAPGPIEARRIAGEFRGAIHLLVTDVVMPKGGGRELADGLCRRRPGLRVLYMSGYTDNAVVANGIFEKEVSFLQKPFTPAALTAKVREVLEATGRTHGAAD